jgi:hypothetical protein
VRTPSSSFRDAGLVPLICPTCQGVGKNLRSQRQLATVHGVVFDILLGKHLQTPKSRPEAAFQRVTLMAV